MFTDKIELKELDKMVPEYKDLLGRVLTIQADCESGGRTLSRAGNAASGTDKRIGNLNNLFF